MLYYLARPVARFVLSNYYRNIDITGLEHIPASGAVILATNHPTAFIEPCIMACFQRRGLYFLARGDLYKNAFATKTLRALNILPVYRLEDGGFGKLRENFGTFEACYGALSAGKAIMILAEGRCIHEKALRPLRKGTARIALGALDRDATLSEVHVVPVGINFTDATSVRSTVMIRCGHAIKASDYLREFREHPNPALNKFTLHLRQRLNPLIVQHTSPEAAAIDELNLEIGRAKYSAERRSGLTHSGEQLDRELRTAVAPERENSLLRLSALLAKTDTKVAAAVRNSQSGGEATAVAQTRFIYAKLLLGVLLQAPLLPIWLTAQWVADTKTNFVEFYSPVRFAAVTIGYFIIVPLLLFLLPWLGKIWVVASLLTTGWSLRAWDEFGAWRADQTWHRATAQDRQLIQRYLREASEPE